MKKGAKILMFIVLGALALVLIVWVTMSLWNWLVPALFSGPVITFWQALGLLVLSKIIFGFGGKGGGHRRGRHWKYHLRDRLAAMTPEERERFREKMKDKWCYRESESSPEQGTSNV